MCFLRIQVSAFSLDQYYTLYRDVYAFKYFAANKNTTFILIYNFWKYLFILNTHLYILFIYKTNRGLLSILSNFILHISKNLLYRLLLSMIFSPMRNSRRHFKKKYAFYLIFVAGMLLKPFAVFACFGFYYF